MFAKVNNTSLIKYPYTYVDLREENPYTRYDGRHTLPEWYAMTEKGLKTSNEIAEIKTAEQPEHNDVTHYLTQKETPELVNDEWLIGWEIKKRPPKTESTNTTNDPA